MTPPSPTRRSLLLGLASLLVMVVVGVTAVLIAGVLGDHRNGTAAADGKPAAATSSAATDTSAAIDAPVAGALTFEALMAPADIADAGVTADNPVALDAPVFPVLCDAPDWGNQWSAPEQGVGHEYPSQGASLRKHGASEYAFGYADDDAASAALARLSADATACPDLSTGGSIQADGTLTGSGDESAVFLVDDGGRNGVIGRTWSVVVRSGSTLLQIAYATEQQVGTGAGPADGSGDDADGAGPVARSTAEALARAALDRFTAQA